MKVAKLVKTKSKAGVWCTIIEVINHAKVEHIICKNHKEAREKAKEQNITII